MSNIRILKYPVNGSGEVTRITCRRKRLLDIQRQNLDLVCWIETDDSLPETTTELVCIGTGWSVDADIFKDLKYLKTVQDTSGYVWHFYEILGMP